MSKEMDLDHIECLLDERLQDYGDQIDNEFLETSEYGERREFIRGKMIALLQCREILENCCNDLMKCEEIK